MPFRRPLRKRLRLFCAEVHPEDGTDPRDWLKNLHGRSSDGRKARQLAGQVAEATALALAELGDDRLSGIDVACVEPAPDASRLLVTLRAPFDADPAVVLAAINDVSGRLRSEVAASITRRKAPLLVYRVLTVGPAGL